MFAVASKMTFMVATWAYCPLLLFAVRWCARDGRVSTVVVAYVLALCASSVPTAVIALTLERSYRQAPLQLFNPSVGNWAFIFGDILVLPAALAFAAYAWRWLPQQGWHVSWWWVLAAMVAGFVATLVFQKQDAAYYTQNGFNLAEVRAVPSKIVHDWAAVPFFASALTLITVPVAAHTLLTAMTPKALTDPPRPVVGMPAFATLAVIVAVSVWFALCVRDSKAGIDPGLLHPPRFDWNRWMVWR